MNNLIILIILVGILIIIIILNTKKNSFGNQNNIIIDIVWSKGYPLYFGNTNLEYLEYIFSSTENPVSKNDIMNQVGNKYIWIKSTSSKEILNNNIKLFLENINSFNYNFVLITTDGDCSIPEDVDIDNIKKLLDNPNLINWYTQNISIPDNIQNIKNIEKIKPIPIGLDLHTYKDSNTPQEQLNSLLKVTNENNKKIQNKKLKIYCDVHLVTHNNKFGNQRKIVGELGFDTIDYQKERIPKIDLWKKYTEYTFVISTHGNGLDCHRTWELLLLGCIIITKTSSIDSLFIDLPVVIVKDWSELNDYTNLEKWKNKYSTQNTQNTQNIYEKLLIKNWIK